jgi:hypothetical protein
MQIGIQKCFLEKTSAALPRRMAVDTGQVLGMFSIAGANQRQTNAKTFVLKIKKAYLAFQLQNEGQMFLARGDNTHLDWQPCYLGTLQGW